MPSFAFAGLPTTLPLTGPTGTGTLALSVQNLTARRLASRATVRPLGAASPAWFSFEGAPPTDPGRLDLEFAPGATGTLRLTVAPPPDAPAGRHVFAVRVGATDDDPDNDFVESPAVAFDVAPRAAAPAAPKPAFPWWIPAVAVVVLLLGGGAAWWLTRGNDAGNATFTVLNRTGRPLRELYVYRSGTAAMGDNLLGNGIIANGTRLPVVLPRGQCENIVQFVYADPRSPDEARMNNVRRVNTCNLEEFALE